MASDYHAIALANEALTRRLLEMTSSTRTVAADSAAHPADRVLQDADAIITHVEVNDRHGVGVLTRRLFGNFSNIISIRSRNYYQGEQDFGDLNFCLAHGDAPPDAVFLQVLNALHGSTVARVLCIPYFPDDVRTALAIKELFGVPLCTYLMDDQNLCTDGIPDRWMARLLARSALRLGISPELCVGYELKYGHKFWLMPPVIPASHLLSKVQPPPAVEPNAGVIIGNIWGQRWVELLRKTVRDSGITLRWYCNGDFQWLGCDKADLARDSIVPHEGPPLPDEQLIQVLRQAWFAVVPTGTLDKSDDRRFIAQLSLPSRIPYILATSHAPIIVLGHRATGAARFVEDLGIGLVADYERQAFRDAVDRITRPDVNLSMRRKALAVAGRFSDVGAAEWLWQSLARGEPMDRRYEDMMPRQRPDLTHLVPARAGIGPVGKKS